MTDALALPASLADVERLGTARLSDEVRGYVAAGGSAQAANPAAWERLRLRPRVLGGVAAPDLRARLLGVDLALPVLVAPTAAHAIVHPDAEAATAAAAAAAGSVMIASTFATRPIEEVARRAPGRTWLQLYVMRSRKLTDALVARAEESGCTAVVLTADVPRPRRGGFRLPAEAIARALLPAGLAEAADLAAAGGIEDVLAPCLGWDELARLRARTALPIVVKGVLRADDAARAVEEGAAGVVVSNHGGRQLDGAVATADVLAEIADAVAGRAAVLVDGGIRRGIDVVRALSLGAQAVLLGRPVLWGLAWSGEAGVRRVLEILRDETAEAMVQCGAASLDALRRDLVFRA